MEYKLSVCWHFMFLRTEVLEIILLLIFSIAFMVAILLSSCPLCRSLVIQQTHNSDIELHVHIQQDTWWPVIQIFRYISVMKMKLAYQCVTVFHFTELHWRTCIVTRQRRTEPYLRVLVPLLVCPAISCRCWGPGNYAGTSQCTRYTLHAECRVSPTDMTGFGSVCLTGLNRHSAQHITCALIRSRWR